MRNRSSGGGNPPAGRETRFYNRLFLAHALIFCLTLLVFAAIAAGLSHQLELDRLLQRERNVLASFLTYYDDKHDEYVHFISQMYDDAGNYAMMSELLERTDTPGFLADPYLKRDVTQRMSRLVSRDNDVEAVLFYSNASGQLFGYLRRYNTFGPLADDMPYAARLRNPIAGRIPLALSRLDVVSVSRTTLVYGIASSVGTMNVRSQAGKVAVLYNADTLSRVFQTYSTVPGSRGLIVSDKDEILFDSEGYVAERTHFPDSFADVDGSILRFGGAGFRVLTQAHPTRKYTGVLLVPASAYVNSAWTPGVLILLAATGVSLLSFLLYLLAGRRATRRIRHLETAMEEVGANNLSNRIPLEPRGDEFTHIARHFNRMCDELQENINRVYVYALRQRGAELKALQARVNPHFLYNTLEMVRARILQEGNVEASDLIARMAGLFRTATKGRPICPVREEIHLLRMFLDLYAFRHEDRFESDFLMTPEAMECGIPRYLLQPLVENYFRHGFDPEREDNRLILSGHVEEGILVLCVEDNGRGIGAAQRVCLQEKLAESLSPQESVAQEDGLLLLEEGFGLLNVHARIRLLFGGSYGLTLLPETGAGVCMLLRLPALPVHELERLAT